MIEAAVVVGRDGSPLHWHAPVGRTSASLPDSRDLWAVLWERRAELDGVAHTHPGSGVPGPSWEDVTTFAAIEAALGRRLRWWIASADRAVIVAWAGPGKYGYDARELDGASLPWLARLRELSIVER